MRITNAILERVAQRMSEVLGKKIVLESNGSNLYNFIEEGEYRRVIGPAHRAELYELSHAYLNGYADAMAAKKRKK